MKSQSTYSICVFNSDSKNVVTLDLFESSAHNREGVVKEWRDSNPERSRIIDKMSNVKIVALVEGGGI